MLKSRIHLWYVPPLWSSLAGGASLRTIIGSAELDDKGGARGDENIAVCRKPWSHLGNQKNGHEDLPLCEVGPRQIDDTVFASRERLWIVFLPDAKVVVQLGACVLEDGALGRAVEPVVLHPQPGHQPPRLPLHLHPDLPVALVAPPIEREELADRWGQSLPLC